MHHLNSTTSRAMPRSFASDLLLSIFLARLANVNLFPPRNVAPFLLTRQFKRHSNVASRAAQRWIRHFLKQPTQKYFAETDNKTTNRFGIEFYFFSASLLCVLGEWNFFRVFFLLIAQSRYDGLFFCRRAIESFFKAPKA